MDKSVLLEKRKNLLNSSKNTSELFLNTHFVDLTLLFSETELLNFIENKAINELKISKTELANKITMIINDANTPEALVDALNSLKFQNKENKNKETLIQSVVDNKLELIETLLEYSLKAKLEYYDSSVWTFYISYGLLEGTVSFVNHDDLIVRAPLINIEIEVFKDENGDIVLRKFNDEHTANGILELSLDDQLEKQTLISEYINKDVFNANEYFQYFSNFLPSLTVDTEYSLIEKTSLEAIKKEPSLKIKKSFFASLINPVGAKMLRDYDEILAHDFQFPVYDTIFHKDLNHLIYDEDQIYEINNPLNLTQKLAVINSQNKNTLIYGPPGTGKSEVVANLIANLLLNNKNIIVISEKKAALDVLDSRLLSLNILAMSAFDEQNNNVFYKKIIDLNHLIVATNKVDLKLQNDDYINLIKYQKIINSLTSYKDTNQKNIYQMLESYDQLDLEFYRRNLETIKFIYNKLNTDKISFETLITNIKLLRDVHICFTNIFNEQHITSEVYNHNRVEEFLKVFNNVDEKSQPFVIAKFIQENKIVDKKSIFQMSNKQIQSLNVQTFIDTFHKIVDNKLKYIVNFKKIFAFIAADNHIEEYVSLYDWTNNTEFNKLINSLSGNNFSQTLIKKYWDYHKLHTKHTDEIIRDFYINDLKNKLLNNHENETKWTELVRIANLNKRPNINKIIKEYYPTLRLVFPIWILSPNATASIIPLNQNEFDYGIFDEASQLRIERGLTLIYRCQFSIVSGDDKQLKPTSFFARSNSLDETYDGHFDNVDSLLDKAKSSNWMSFTLDNHYRSINEQLIRFSSHYFYDDKLICITKNGNFKKSIEVFDEKGEYDRENGINVQEANKVIQCLLSYFDVYPTAIVITFNAKQADYIQHLALAKPQLHKRLETLTLKIRSLENVQGDEASLVIISCTFGKDKNGRFLQNFGPVNQDGGKNRINVMASRAKEKMILIKSFMSGDITNDKNENTSIFKNFISYAEEINKSQDDDPADVNKQSNVTDANDIIDKLTNELSLDKDLVIQKYKQIGTHTIDLAISKINNPNISLCVLVDSQHKTNQYSKDIKNWIKDIDRQKYYEDRGYRTYRFNILEFNLNRRNLINNLKQQII